MKNRKILTRMGDGSLIELPDAELRQDLEEGTRDVTKGKRGHANYSLTTHFECC